MMTLGVMFIVPYNITAYRSCRQLDPIRPTNRLFSVIQNLYSDYKESDLSLLLNSAMRCTIIIVTLNTIFDSHV